MTDKGRKKAFSNVFLNILLVVSVVVLIAPFVRDGIVSAISSKAPKDEEVNQTFRIEIKDGADLLSNDEEDALREELAAVAKHYNVAFVSTKEPTGLSARERADLLLSDLFADSHGILFLIDMYNREIYIRAGDSVKHLTVAKCETITDNVYTYASAGDYYQCASKAFSQIARIVEGKSVPEVMKHMSNALLALSAGFFAAFIIANAKTRIKRPSQVLQFDGNTSKELILSNVNIVPNSVTSRPGAGATALNIAVDVIRIASSSGGGGSHGSGRSGGGSHGGGSHGGGHRF